MSFRQELIDLRNQYEANLEEKEKEKEKKERDRKLTASKEIIGKARTACRLAASEGENQIKVMTLTPNEDYCGTINKQPVINSGSIFDLVKAEIENMGLDWKIKRHYDDDGNRKFSLYASWE